MEQAPNRGHEASSQSGLSFDCRRCSSSKIMHGLGVRVQARHMRTSLLFSFAGASSFLCPPCSVMRRGAWKCNGGFVSLTKEPRYLGYIANSPLTSNADVGKHIRSAAMVFGALRSVLCNFALGKAFRGKVYSALVRAVLLYGSEVWCPCDDILAKLRSFHGRSYRAMCRVTMEQTRGCTP